MDTLLLDPITHEALQAPVLASDGHTYSLVSLRAAMAGDPLHRSPVTRETLRRCAYKNTVAAKWAGNADADADADELVWLWEEPEDSGGGDGGGTATATATASLSTLQTLTVELPPCIPPPLATALVKLGMDKLGGPVVLTVRTHSEGSDGRQTLVHPPPPEQAWDACVELCTATFGKLAFRNPWCIAGAQVTLKGPPGRDAGTVESHWLAAWQAQR